MYIKTLIIIKTFFNVFQLLQQTVLHPNYYNIFNNQTLKSYLVTFREFLVDFFVKVFPLAPGDLEELVVYFSQAGYSGAHFELPETFFAAFL